MTVKLPCTALLAVAAVLSVLLGGLLAIPAQSLPAGAATPATTTSRATPTAPTVGACHAYTYRQGQDRAETTPPVDCATPHTALTVAVLSVASTTSDRAVARASRSCLKAVRSAVGSSLPRTAYAARYFLPTRSEAEQGARWLRCDVVLAAGRQLATLPTPLVATPLPDTAALCAVIRGKATLATVCAGKHDFRFTATAKARGKRYPGETALLRTVIRTCGTLVSTPKRFWAFYPDEIEWNAGLRDISCLSRSTT